MRMPGVEPGSQAWEACMMPLHYMRQWLDEMVWSGVVGKRIALCSYSAISHHSHSTKTEDFRKKHV